MGEKFKTLKKQLQELEKGEMSHNSLQARKKGGVKSRTNAFSGWYRYLLFGAFLFTFLIYVSGNYNFASKTLNPVEQFVEWVDQPNEELLNEMGDWMEEMGYTGLTKQDLIDLREEGVTATFTSRMRDLGYSDLTLDQLVRLRQNEVSATFSAMMKELNYELSIEDLIRLRQHGVTAYYTSNLHDLGYQDVTIEELIRLKDTGVRTSVVEKLVEENETKPTLEEIIRYHISNQ